MLSLIGCSSPSSRSSLEIHEGRYQAASAINSIEERDTALISVAIDAAKAGHGDVAKKAVNEIKCVDDHDSTAHKCAILLSKKGQAGVAANITKSINWIDLRDKTCAKIAERLPF